MGQKRGWYPAYHLNVCSTATCYHTPHGRPAADPEAPQHSTRMTPLPLDRHNDAVMGFTCSPRPSASASETDLRPRPSALPGTHALATPSALVHSPFPTTVGPSPISGACPILSEALPALLGSTNTPAHPGAAQEGCGLFGPRRSLHARACPGKLRQEPQLPPPGPDHPLDEVRNNRSVAA